MVSNDGGFASASSFDLAEGIPWTLDSSGSERLPKSIYARFKGGESGPETYLDDIILDETAPAILSLTAKPQGAKKKRTYRLRIKARDTTSGLDQMQVTSKRRRPGELRPFSKRSTFSTSGRKIYVRVRDQAGNFSPWARAER